VLSIEHRKELVMHSRAFPYTGLLSTSVSASIEAACSARGISELDMSEEPETVLQDVISLLSEAVLFESGVHSCLLLHKGFNAAIGAVMPRA
jgi:hypothetical protein